MTRLGITGHQCRPGIDWRWVRQSIDDQFARALEPLTAFSCLAEGSDQIFAESALCHAAKLIAVIPMADYAAHFSTTALEGYKRLLLMSQIVHLDDAGPPEQAFFRAGMYVVDNSDLLIAVWDGERAKGLGGTEDIVRYALDKGCPIIHMNPVTRVVVRKEVDDF